MIMKGKSWRSWGGVWPGAAGSQCSNSGMLIGAGQAEIHYIQQVPECLWAQVVPGQERLQSGGGRSTENRASPKGAPILFILHVPSLSRIPEGRTQCKLKTEVVIAEKRNRWWIEKLLQKREELGRWDMDMKCKWSLEVIKWTFLQSFLMLDVGGCADGGGGKTPQLRNQQHSLLVM